MAISLSACGSDLARYWVADDAEDRFRDASGGVAPNRCLTWFHRLEVEIRGRKKVLSMNVLDQVPQPHQAVVVHVLENRAPELLKELRRKELSTYAAVEQVEDTMYEAVSEHYLPGHEVDSDGLSIEDALVAFVGEFPNDRLPDSPLHRSGEKD